jgi:hypothetical protein
MISIRKHILGLIAMLIVGFSYAQGEPEKAGRMEDGKFTLTINLNWTPAQMTRLAELFDLDSLIIKAISENNFIFINDSTDWTATINRQQELKLIKEIGSPADLRLDKIILDRHHNQPIVSGRVDAIYGVNQFTNPKSFSSENQKTCFVLPGYENARSVFLSGSFNQWSTMQTPMTRTDSGWVACTEIPPGKYHYKFIVDGRWIHDPNNKLRERDGQRGFNSVAFCYNYTFNLKGYPDARRVIVAGSFNGFNPRELNMVKTPEGWSLPIYLREGTHSYKFIVDGQWMTDPANPIVRPDGRGNENSFMGIGDSLIFKLIGFPDARRVVLAGTFNNWNPGELIMEKVGNTWQIPYVLGPGNHEYKFIVDGRWITDPANPYKTGSGNFTNSFLAFVPTHQFNLRGYENAQKVIVTGSFNNWNTNDYRMVMKNGEWIFPIHLQPGRYSYKFIVDGQWIVDPMNPLAEINEFGGQNSVMWIEF